MTGAERPVALDDAIAASERAVAAIRDLLVADEASGRVAHRVRVLLDDAFGLHARVIAESWRRADGDSIAPTANTITRLRQTADDLERFWPEEVGGDA